MRRQNGINLMYSKLSDVNDRDGVVAYRGCERQRKNIGMILFSQKEEKDRPRKNLKD